MTTKKEYCEEITAFLTREKIIRDHKVERINFLSSRGIAAQVELANGQFLFVKKTHPYLQRNGSWFERLQAAQLLPEIIFSTAPKLLKSGSEWAVYEYLVNYTPFATSFEPLKHSSLAASLGNTLASLHSESAAGLKYILSKTGPGAKPQASIRPQTALTPQQYAEFPGLDRDHFLKTAFRCADAQIQLAKSLANICIVHGDYLGTNIMMGSQQLANKVALIDWDRAGIGDPSWDIGHLFAATVRRWVETREIQVSSLSQFLIQAQEGWSSYAAWMTSFLHAYCQTAHSGITDVLSPAKIAGSAGQALFSRSKNILFFQGQYSQRSTLLLALAEQLLTQPEAAVNAFLPRLKGLV